MSKQRKERRRQELEIELKIERLKALQAAFTFGGAMLAFLTVLLTALT